jgi:hypothetical protein
LAQSVAVSKVPSQQFFELPQEGARRFRIVTMAFHVGDQIALSDDVDLILADMLFGLGQLLL